MEDGNSGDEKILAYFMERTEKDLQYIREKVDKLWDFRLLLIGGSMALGAIGGVVVQLVIVFMRMK